MNHTAQVPNRYPCGSAAAQQQSTENPTGEPGNPAPPATTNWRGLLPLLEQCGAPLLPIGAGAEQKGPVDPATGYGLGGWQQHPGFTAAEISSTYGPVIAAGIKTGGQARILVLDIDGATASNWIRAKGIEPDSLGTWRISRNTDPERFKLVFRLTAEQEVEFPQTKLLLTTKQRDKEKGTKGEAVEVYFQPGAQVVAIGAHPSSGGNYFWQGSPAEIATPDAGVMALLQAIKSAVEQLRGKGDPSRPPKGTGASKGQWRGSSHRNPCPICGRDHSAACTRSIAPDGAEFASCYQGSTFQPPLNLKAGETITGNDGREWAFVREYKTDEIGWKSLFKIHTARPPRPAPEPPEGTPAQQAPWGQGDTPAELQGPRQRVASFQSLIQQLEKGWRWDEKEEVYKAAALSAGKLASLLPADALRFNEMTLRGEVQTRHGWQQITDADLDSAYVVLTDLGWRIGPEIVVKAVMHAARQAPHHPVRDYLQRVAADSSITPFDLDQVAPRFFRATKPLHVAMVRAWLIGAAARALKPGCQMDYCLVLQSREQGLRKSRSLEALASPDWYCSSIPEAEKDLLLNIHSTWIYELAELESVTSRKEAGRLKNLITTSTDVLRVPYGRTSERMPRQSVLCATVNEDTFLRDDTGNRRFWVVPIDGREQLDHGGLIAARDAIWKAAVLAHREGELPMLAPELERESEQQNEQFNAQDSWDAMVLAWMDGEPLHRWDPERDPSTTPYDPNKPFTSAEVLYSAGLRRPDQITRADEMRVAAVLKRLGFTKGQGTVSGRVVRHWTAPPPSQPSQPSQPLSAEVVKGQTHCAAMDLGGASQPSQPFSSKKGIDRAGSALAPAAENDPPFGNRGCEAPPTPPRPAAAQSISASQPLSGEVVKQPEVVKLPAPIPPHAPLPACDWLPLVLQLRQANPGALPAELANLLQAHHGISTSGREVRDQLAAWDLQQQQQEVA